VATTVYEAWQRDAECRGAARQYFFPPAASERREQREQREQLAKAVCARCAAREACLEFALRENEAHGIWGGLTELERKQLVSRATS
jgi:WhiB family redox-sensing transcriptional regulator